MKLPREKIFAHAGQHRTAAGPQLAKGVENVAALLTDALSAEQLQMIAALMDERGCDAVEIL